MQPTLLVFAKAPVLGRVKTRLARTLGDADALAVYHRLLAITARAVRAWRGEIRVLTAGDATAFTGTPLGAFPSFPQCDGNLGTRLAAGFAAVDGPAVGIGTDCPSLSPEHLQALVRIATGHPLAFGPARDGGYWGVAISDPRCIPVCFAEDLPWSQPSLLAETVARLSGIGIVPGMAETLDDLDDSADLHRAERDGFAWRATGGSA